MKFEGTDYSRRTCISITANVSAMRSAGLRGTHYQNTQAYERGRTLDITNKPALRMSGC